MKRQWDDENKCVWAVTLLILTLGRWGFGDRSVMDSFHNCNSRVIKRGCHQRKRSDWTEEQPCNVHKRCQQLSPIQFRGSKQKSSLWRHRALWGPISEWLAFDLSHLSHATSACAFLSGVTSTCDEVLLWKKSLFKRERELKIVIIMLNYGIKNSQLWQQITNYLHKKQGWNVLLHIYIYQLVNIVWT